MENAAKKKVLIIDDEQELVAMLARYFRKNGFKALTAFDGISGLQKARVEHPDVIVLDLLMPRMPGEEVCREIRKDETLAKTPVVMLTVKSGDVNRIVGRVIGADYYIEKPFEVEALLAKVQLCVTKKR